MGNFCRAVSAAGKEGGMSLGDNGGRSCLLGQERRPDPAPISLSTRLRAEADHPVEHELVGRRPGRCPRLEVGPEEHDHVFL